MNHTISDTDYVELSTFAEEQWHKVLNYLGRTFNLPREDCQDVFQDAFIVLYNQINEVTTFTPQIVLYTAVGIGTREWLIGVIFRARFHPRLIGLHIADLIVPF